MLKRPQSPSNIPTPIQQDARPKSSPRAPRKLPQAVVPGVPSSKKKTPQSETKIPTPVFGRKRSVSREEVSNDENGEEAARPGVAYITENLIRKVTKEDEFSRIFKLVISIPKDLNKKVKFIENLEPLRNLQILSIAHNAIERMERLDKLVNLQVLDLSDNLIEKIEGIGNLQQLTVLNLEDNKIETLPIWIGKKLKCLKTFKIAKNELKSLHELYKLRALPDLVQVTTEGNPMCSLQHHREISVFLLRSLEVLNGNQVTEDERKAADERFEQEEIRYLEGELEKTEKRLQDTEAEREKYEQLVNILEQNDINLKKSNKVLQREVSGLKKDIEAKDSLLESKTTELSKACQKQFKLEQELAFYKLDTKFDEFWKFSGYEGEEYEDEYIDEDKSAYIGKARFKPNSLAREKILPSKAQMVNLIKLVTRDDDNGNEINRTVVRDLQEALNIDLEEKQKAIAEAEERLVEVEAELANRKAMDANENYYNPPDATDAPQGLAGIEEREKAREAIAKLIQEAKELQSTNDELKDKIAEAEQLLKERDAEVKKLREDIDDITDSHPDYDKLLFAVAAKEEQCHQLEEYMEQLTSLIAETENDLADKAEEIRALEMKLKIGEPSVQKEMKHGLEDVVKKLTGHLEDLRSQMQKQKVINSDLGKERDFLLRKVEQLENDGAKMEIDSTEFASLQNELIEKENALKAEMEMNDKLRSAHEKLLARVNKKKRHVGIGSRNVWFDPEIENLKAQAQNSEDEVQKLKKELERINKQREAERSSLEERLEHEQAKLDEAVQAARDAGDFKREAKELDRQLQRLQAEKSALKQMIDDLEDDLTKERDESIPLKSLLRQLQSLLNEVDSGEVARRSPVIGVFSNDKKLQRLFGDLREKIQDKMDGNEEEKQAKLRELEKFQAKIEKIQDELTSAQGELSEANHYATQLEQESQDYKEQLEQTQNRLKKALNERSDNEKLIGDEIDALQNRLNESERAAAKAKKEVNQLRSKLDEADRKMRAVEQLAKEAEFDFENAKAEVDELKTQLKKAINDRVAQAKRDEEEIDSLNEALKRQGRDKEQGDQDLETLRDKLLNAEKRIKEAEHKTKQLQHEIDLDKSRIDELQKELEALKKQQRKEKAAHKNELVGTREKFERLQNGFENDIGALKNQIKDDENHINHLKDQLKKSKKDFQSEIDGLAQEIAELQAEVLNKESQFQMAEENNNRLLENIARLEDENNALNDHANAVEKEAADMLQNERVLHAKELRDLEDEVDNLKRLMNQVQLNHKTQAYERERSAFNSLAHEIDNLRQKVVATDKEAEGRERHHMNFKKRLSDEIERLRKTVDDKEYESRLLHDKNKVLHQRMADEIENALNQISNLKRTLAYREEELSSLRNSTEPLIAEYRGKISRLLDELQAKEDELNGLRRKLNDTVHSSMSGSRYVIANDSRLDKVSHEIEALKASIANLQQNASVVLSASPERTTATTFHQTYTPLRPSALDFTTNLISSPQPQVYQTPASPVHHHHYGSSKNVPLDTIVSSSATPNGTVHIHHHDNDVKDSKKKKKSPKKTVTYDDEFCNVPDHENMSDQMHALESRLRDSTLTRSKLSSNSPLKLELKQLEEKVADAVTRRARMKQMRRSRYVSDYP